jgi:hypothetical protein
MRSMVWRSIPTVSASPLARTTLIADGRGFRGSTAKRISGNSELAVQARFKSFYDIVDHCCYAWNTCVEQPWKIIFIARREWASVDHSL